MLHMHFNILDAYARSFAFRTIGYLNGIYMLSIY